MNPSQFQANAARHIADKVQRWTIRFADFDFTVEQIPGENSVWADILTRWAAPGYSKFLARRVGAICILLIAEDDPELPSLKVISDAQNKFPPRNKNSLNLSFHKCGKENFELSTGKDGDFYVPSEDEELQL